MSMQQSKILQLEMLNMQQVSKDGTKEVSAYVENVKSNFVEQIFSASDIKATMENRLLEWWAFLIFLTNTVFYLYHLSTKL